MFAFLARRSSAINRKLSAAIPSAREPTTTVVPATTFAAEIKDAALSIAEAVRKVDNSFSISRILVTRSLIRAGSSSTRAPLII